MQIRDFKDARDYLRQYPPKWAWYLPQECGGLDRIDEPGGDTNPRYRKNYALPYEEIQFYDVIADDRAWLDAIRRRWERRGRVVPDSQTWLPYILPTYRVWVSSDKNCATEDDNTGTAFAFASGNLFVLFPTAAQLWARRSEWGGNLVFVQRSNPNAIAFTCWNRTWRIREYMVRWLDMPQAFWDEVLAALCQNSGTTAPCCTRNVRGIYVDGWIEWHRFTTGGVPAGQFHTPIASESLYTNAQAVEAWRQFCYQLRYILREHDAYRSERPNNYSPEVCSNTYNALGLETSTAPYRNSYVVPADGYIQQTIYVNRDSWAWDWYTNPDRRTDSIMVEEWYWSLYGTQPVSGTTDIYQSTVVGNDRRDARILTALRHGLKVYLQVPHAVSRDDYEAKVIQIAKFWSKYRTEFPDRIFFSERNHREVPRTPDGRRINFVPYNGDPTDRRAGYPQLVSRLLRWDYDANPKYRPIKLTLDHGEAQ